MARIGTRVGRLARTTVIVVGLAVASIAGYCGVTVYEGNFHVVDQGRFYRSAQLSKDEFARVIREYRIKSILNLRGPHLTEPWYDDEIAVATQLGVVHYDYSMSATAPVTPERIAKILDIVRAAPKPILVHCKSGADRSGLVSALYRYAIEGKRAGDADRQLTLLYGHFPYLTSRTGAMDESFWRYVERTSPGPSGRQPTPTPR